MGRREGIPDQAIQIWRMGREQMRTRCPGRPRLPGGGATVIEVPPPINHTHLALGQSFPWVH